MTRRRSKHLPRRGRRHAEAPPANQDGRGKHAPLTREQREFLFLVAAEARILRVPVAPKVRAAWQERYGEPLRVAVEKFYLYGAEWRTARAEALRGALDDPGLHALVDPGVIALKLHELAEEARRGIVVDAREVRWQDPAADWAWRTKCVDVVERDLPTALATYKELLAIGERVGSLRSAMAQSSTSAAEGPVGKMRALHADLMDEDDISKMHTPPELARELIAQEHVPFHVPDKDATFTPYEKHLAMMRKWEEEGIAPPGANPRPTKRVLADGTVQDLVVASTQGAATTDVVAPCHAVSHADIVAGMAQAEEGDSLAVLDSNPDR